MKSCIAIRHVSFEDLGIFGKPIEDAGYEISYLEAPFDDLSVAEQADLVVFLGGPIGVYEEEAYPYLQQELAVAAHRLAANKPMLGLCLGAQIIARAAGAKVYPGDNGKEIGWYPITLTQAGQESPMAALGQGDRQMLHWHGDTFDLPQGSVLLASSARYENQIFSMGDNVLAFQCHPEADPTQIENWLVGHALEIALTEGTGPLKIREETGTFGQALVARGQLALTRWLQNL